MTIIEQLNDQNKFAKDQKRMEIAKIKNDELKKEINTEFDSHNQTVKTEHTKILREQENALM